MANSEHLAKIWAGVKTWNDWRSANAEIVPDFSGANLIEADLRRVDLGETNLSGALFRADLSRADT
jgi:uncharacterized protein YjbI with pentapeptide repeats